MRKKNHLALSWLYCIPRGRTIPCIRISIALFSQLDTVSKENGSTLVNTKMGCIRLKQESIRQLTGFDISQCTYYTKAQMCHVREIPWIHSPAGHLPPIFLLALR